METFFNIPVLQLVMIASSVNVNQQSGSGSTLLDFKYVSYTNKYSDSRPQLTKTGGSIAVRAFGSTGCLIVGISSSASVEIVEPDRNLLVTVVAVSAL